MPTSPQPLDQRIKRNVKVDDAGCWVWQLHRDRDGYGVIAIKHYPHAAHRISYEVFIGPIPGGTQIDHRCRNRACVRPEHLEAVTSRANTFAPGSEAPAAVNAAKSTCPKGHPYSLLRGKRVCRPCRNEASARYRAKQKAAK